jgi:hypothetical protein
MSSTGSTSALNFAVNVAGSNTLRKTLSFTAGLSTTDTVFYAGAEAEAARIDTSGRLLVGTSTSLETNGTLQVVNNTNNATAQLHRFSTGTGGPGLRLSKARGTTSSPLIVSNGDTIGSLIYSAYDGTQFFTSAQILGQVDGTPGANDMPGRLVFSTTADGASSPTERMRISNAGQIAVAGAGTAAAPVITKNDDLNTGIFFPAADTIAFAEGGSEAARIDSSGRLLVGTSSGRLGGSLQVETIGNTNSRFTELTNNAINAAGPIILFRKSRG